MCHNSGCIYDRLVIFGSIVWFSVLWCCWLGGRKGIRPVKNLSGGVLAWLSVWSEVQTCIWPSWCHCHSLSLASAKSRLVLPFWYWLTRVVPEKGPLNGCVCVCMVFGVGQLNCASQIWLRQTPVAVVTKICDFQYKIYYNLACVGDTAQMHARNRGFSRSANLMMSNFAQTKLYSE